MIYTSKPDFYRKHDKVIYLPGPAESLRLLTAHNPV